MPPIKARRIKTLKSPEHADDRLLKPGEVSDKFGVNVSTLRNWDADGIIKPAQRTAGGHRRYRESEVQALLAELEQVA